MTDPHFVLSDLGTRTLLGTSEIAPYAVRVYGYTDAPRVRYREMSYRGEVKTVEWWHTSDEATTYSSPHALMEAHPHEIA